MCAGRVITRPAALDIGRVERPAEQSQARAIPQPAACVRRAEVEAPGAAWLPPRPDLKTREPHFTYGGAGAGRRAQLRVPGSRGGRPGNINSTAVEGAVLLEPLLGPLSTIRPAADVRNVQVDLSTPSRFPHARRSDSHMKPFLAHSVGPGDQQGSVSSGLLKNNPRARCQEPSPPEARLIDLPVVAVGDR